MLPSMISNFLWGTPRSAAPLPTPEELAKAELEHTTREEPGDWLVISYQHSSDSNSNSRLNSECDVDSVCSDSSWVITPAPTFRRSVAGTSSQANHPLEDLLIEHPTMSVYHQHCSHNQNDASSSSSNINEQTDLGANPPNDIDQEENLNEQNQKREQIMLQNRQRHRLAVEMQIPFAGEGAVSRIFPLDMGARQPRLTRRALKRHNMKGVSRQVMKHQVQKCGFKAGRRRC